MLLSRKSGSLLAGVAVSALALSGVARADSFTVVNGQTVNSTQILNTPGDVGTVEQGGTINSSAGEGIIASANGVTINNAGSVTAFLYSIRAADNNTIANSGASTGVRYGISANDNNTITNSGTATGSTYYGIIAFDHNTITNSGTSTGGFDGIYVFDNNAITNSGTSRGGTDGIKAFDNNTITNSGRATGSTFYGIYANSKNRITNSGTVTGGQLGIVAQHNNTISNSGMIKGGTAAVDFGGAINTLTLLAGSKIEGNLQLGNASNRLVIGPGLNTALAYQGGNIVDTGLPFIIDGAKLYAVDVTGFSVQDEMANDLTRAISDAVDARLGAARAAGQGLSTAMNGTVVHAVADVPAGPGHSLWLSGLGSVRDQEGDSDTGSFNSLLGGFVVGGDALISTDTRAGLFAGASFADLDTEGDGQDLESKSAFAGA